MIRIEIDNDRSRVDKVAVATAFGISRAELEQRMNLGEIKSWFERRGGGFHEREHLIFFSPGQGIRIAADKNGNIIERVEEAPGQPARDFRAGDEADVAAEGA